MSRIVTERIARGEARRLDQPPVVPAVRHQIEADRNFGLPNSLYAATIACYLGFLAIVGSAFANPGLAIPMAVIVLLIAAFFGVPAIWTRLKENASRPATQGEFEAHGIMTLTGHLSAGEASAQVLVLPVLLVCWGLAVALIAALVA